MPQRFAIGCLLPIDIQELMAWTGIVWLTVYVYLRGCDLIYFILYYGWCFEPQHAWCSRSSINSALKVCKYCLYGSVMVGKGCCELMNGFNLSLTAYHQPIIVLYFHAVCYTNFKILHSFVYLFDTVTSGELYHRFIIW